ncbi:hypothetical protein JL720_14911 [Aureococcus anophagefferens]|nr:hypothetical protein JL720_14911 [Aureococcus anophagefferens]
MCAMALCYGPALAIHRAGNDGYALSTPKIVAAGDLGFVRYGLGNEGLDRDAISWRGRCDCASVPSQVVDAVGCVDGGGVDCACSDKGVDKVRFCDGWRYLSIWGRRYRDHRVAYAGGSALAASIVLVVAAFYFDRTLGKVVARRRTIQAEPADYTIIVKGLPPTATIASVREHFSSLYDLKGPPRSELRYNETVDCGGDAYAYDGLDYDQLPPLELDAYGDISPLPRGAGLDVAGTSRRPPLRASRWRVEAVPKVCRSRGGRSDDKQAHALFPCGANATCDTLAVTCACAGCGVCDDPARGRPVARQRDDVALHAALLRPVRVRRAGLDRRPGLQLLRVPPSLLAACFCRFNLGAKKAALILAGRRKPAEADVCAKTLRNVMVAFLLKIAVALLVVLVNELIVNTALLALAINASLKRDESPGVDEGADRTNLLGGSHPASCGGDDFERC